MCPDSLGLRNIAMDRANAKPKATTNLLLEDSDEKEDELVNSANDDDPAATGSGNVGQHFTSFVPSSLELNGTQKRIKEEEEEVSFVCFFPL